MISCTPSAMACNAMEIDHDLWAYSVPAKCRINNQFTIIYLNSFLFVCLSRPLKLKSKLQKSYLSQLPRRFQVPMRAAVRTTYTDMRNDREKKNEGKKVIEIKYLVLTWSQNISHWMSINSFLCMRLWSLSVHHVHFVFCWADVCVYVCVCTTDTLLSYFSFRRLFFLVVVGAFFGSLFGLVCAYATCNICLCGNPKAHTAKWSVTIYMPFIPQSTVEDQSTFS